ncbi:glycine cleavage system protein R [Salsipaludibacter albus]|uniref:glycine cleavage system protein R n=1 Tax=Salsipaludibacter albus TaxID=2849650 RepID=UPI001EE427A2|nr:ACT domain-containing protein [Salsipaludibacter albus]MBY5161220.1 ACT domain-containing protein [Salsipaludibacter albus]
MADVAVTALGTDRPGIVAAIAEVLRDHGSNVSEATMTTLAGHVAVVFQVRTPDTPEALQADLDTATAPLGISVSVAPASGRGPTPPATHLLSVYGPDQPGLLAEVTRAVADSGATIIGFDSQVLADEEPSTWAMSAEVVAPREPGRLGGDLDDACERLGLDHGLTELGG